MGLPSRDNLVNDRLRAKVIESVATAFVCLQLRVRGVDVSGRLKAEGKEGATLVFIDSHIRLYTNISR